MTKKHAILPSRQGVNMSLILFIVEMEENSPLDTVTPSPVVSPQRDSLSSIRTPESTQQRARTPESNSKIALTPGSRRFQESVRKEGMTSVSSRTPGSVRNETITSVSSRTPGSVRNETITSESGRTPGSGRKEGMISVSSRTPGSVRNETLTSGSGRNPGSSGMEGMTSGSGRTTGSGRKGLRTPVSSGQKSLAVVSGSRSRKSPNTGNNTSQSLVSRKAEKFREKGKILKPFSIPRTCERQDIMFSRSLHPIKWIIWLWQNSQQSVVLIVLGRYWPVINIEVPKKWAATCNFQQNGILTWTDSDKPVKPPLNLEILNDVRSVA